MISPFDIGRKTIITKIGKFAIDAFYDGQNEAIVLRSEETLSSETYQYCKIQYDCLWHYRKYFDCSGCDDDILKSLALIKEKGGIIILLHKKNIGLISLFAENQKPELNYKIEIDKIEIVYNVLKYCGIRKINLLTLNIDKYNFLCGLSKSDDDSISIKRVWYGGQCFIVDEVLDNMILRVGHKELFKPLSGDKRHVLVIGDLNVDYDLIEKEASVGGSGYNAWRAFGEDDYVSILYGTVGSDNSGNYDPYGAQIYKEIKNHIEKSNEKNMYAFVGKNERLRSCEVNMIRVENDQLKYCYSNNNANDYDVEKLKKVLTLIDFKKDDYVFISSYLYVQKKYDVGKCKEFLSVFNDIEEDKRPKIVFDIASYSVEKSCEAGKMMSVDVLGEIFNGYKGKIHALIGEYNIMKGMINNELKLGHNKSKIDISIFKSEKKCYRRVEYLVCRFGHHSVKKQKLIATGKEFGEIGEYVLDNKDMEKYRKNSIGYGDFMTVKILRIIRDECGE